MGLHYLVEAANEIFRITGKTFEPSLQEMAEVLVRGCRTLQRLEKDDDFERDLFTLAQVDSEQRKRREMILADVTHFTQGFLQIEEKVLIDAGLNKVATCYLLKRARELHTACKGNMGPVDPQDIKKAIKLLRSVVCDLAMKADGLSKQKKSHVRSVIERVTLAIAGGVVIFTNASTAAATVGLSAAGSAVSAAVGVALITEAAAQLRS